MKPQNADGWHPGYSPWTIALTVTLATFMEVLDSSIANVTLPHVSGGLSVSIDQSTWVLTSYLVANAIVLPISGFMMKKFGRKRFYMTSVVIFTVSSLLCGLAPSLGWLVFFRILQGIGGGGIGPCEQAILTDTFPPPKRGMAFAVYGMAVVCAPTIGPTLGGLITDTLSWRWVYFINIPVGIVSLLLTQRIVTDPPWLTAAGKGKAPIDFVGLGLIIVGLGSLEIVLDKGQEDDWFHSHRIVGFSIAALVSLVTFVFWERRQEHPIVDVRLFKNRSFAIGCGMILTLGLSLYATTVLLPHYAQSTLGYNAATAGQMLSLGGLVTFCMMPIVGRLVTKIDPRVLIVFGFTALSMSLGYMARHLYAGMDFRTAALLRAYQAFSMAFLFVPVNIIVYGGIPPERSGAASGTLNLARNMGGDIGVALVTTILARRTQVHHAVLASHATSTGQDLARGAGALGRALVHSGSTSSEAAHQAAAIVYRTMQREARTLACIDALHVVCVLAACLAPMALLLKRPAPRGGPPPRGGGPAPVPNGKPSSRVTPYAKPSLTSFSRHHTSGPHRREM